MTNLPPEQMMADVKLLRAAAESHLEWCHGDECSCPLHQALAATDRPEYKEEG